MYMFLNKSDQFFVHGARIVIGVILNESKRLGGTEHNFKDFHDGSEKFMNVVSAIVCVFRDNRR